MKRCAGSRDPESAAWLREQRRGDVRWLQVDDPGWRLVFTMRHGGRSDPPYDSLNVGFLVGDRPRDVHANRVLIATALGIRLDDVVVPHQVHGKTVRCVDHTHRGSGARNTASALADTDALVTADAATVLMIAVADCVPVFIAAETPAGTPALGLAHAGWRGLVAGVVTDTAEALGRLGRLRTAVVGPSIGPCCFAVGTDVGQTLERRFPGVWRDGQVDLWSCARQELLRAGVPEVRVSGVCTSCDPRFYSHRRDGGATGRQAALAWITEGGVRAEGRRRVAE